jgi:hypothetical protein
MRKAGLSLVLALLAISNVHAQLNGVTAELKLDQDQFLPGEQVPLKVHIMNRSGQEVVFGSDNNWLSVYITRENGSVSSASGEMPVKGEFSLLSGQEGTRTLYPTPYFDFHQPGRYRVTATIRLPQWQQEIACRSTTFTVANGVPLPGLANLQFGLPPAPGVTNAIPEVRRYSLLKISYVRELKLYFRLTDSADRTLRVFPIAQMTSFSYPEAQIDRSNNFNVLVQIGARVFSYCVINPNGQWIAHQTHIYTDTRPELRVDTEGKVFIAGGARRPSPDDLPAPESARQP